MAKNIVLIYLPNSDGLPLAYAYLISNTDNKKYNITVFDLVLENITPDTEEFKNRINDLNPEIVGITCRSTEFYDALHVLKKIKEINPDICTVMGGAHATSCPRITIANEEIDFLILSEAEFSFPAFLDEYFNKNPDYSRVDGLVYKNSNNEIISNPIKPIEKLDDIKFPDYNAVNIEEYIKQGYNYQLYNPNIKRNAPIWVTRGCPYRCAFCSVPLINGNKIRRHSIEYMIRWITFLYEEYNIRGFSIIDDNFTFYTDYAKDFCKEVIKLSYNDVEFNTPNGVRMQRSDSELWKLMKQAGWKGVTVAPESGSERVLKSMRKNLNVKEIPAIIKNIKKAGLKVRGFFMVGYPGETLEDLEKTKKLIKKCKFFNLSISYFQPMPGTPIYDELVEKKEIHPDTMPALFNDKIKSYRSPTLAGIDLSKFRYKMSVYTSYLSSPMGYLRLILKVLKKPGKIVEGISKIM